MVPGWFIGGFARQSHRGTAGSLLIVLAGALTACNDASVSPTDPGPRGNTAPVSASLAASASTINLFDNYSRSAPHFTHISFLAHGGYIANGKATAAQLDFDVHHIDHFFVGPTTKLKTAEPTVTNIPYAILLTVPIPAYSTYASGLSIDFNADMAAWYAAHPQYKLENAFLHNPDGSRKSLKIWYSGPQNNRWLFNPADPGITAYHIDRLVRLLKRESIPADGIFVDEMGPWSGAGNYTGTKEYPTASDATRVKADLVTFVRAIRNGLGAGKMLMINTGDYSDPHHLNLIAAAGASHKEMYNTPFTNVPQRWLRADQMLASGAVVSYPSPYSSSVYATRAGFTAGNSASAVERARLVELAAYYMVLTTPDKLWLVRKDLEWYRIYEANIGRPTAVRSVLKSGTDGAGLAYKVWQRPFERGLVVTRPQLAATQTGQLYDDRTLVTVALPPGTWYVLNMDGTTAGPVTSVRLRQSEAVILTK